MMQIRRMLEADGMIIVEGCAEVTIYDDGDGKVAVVVWGLW